ncbi:MAG: hypothetical protein VX497_07045, partial [Candidatus Neomarinimicrobiota bacterium]|nr:hypothetical protein [Candidatus Neomarinimicrobiota bacterium]
YRKIQDYSIVPFMDSGTGELLRKMDINQIDYNHLEVIIEMYNNCSDYIIIEYCDMDIEELKN